MSRKFFNLNWADLQIRGGIEDNSKIIFLISHQKQSAAEDILIFYFYLSKKIRLDFSCESSA